MMNPICELCVSTHDRRPNLHDWTAGGGRALVERGSISLQEQEVEARFG